MCIAIYKPVGKDIPTKTSLKTCFTNNPDGAGFMYAYGDVVHIDKGFNTFDSFYKALKKVIKLCSQDNGKDLSMVYHFRISTQGGVQKELCHPYPICDNYDDMRKLHTTANIALAHNGIITLTSNYNVKDHNDTMEFIKEILSPMIDNRRNFYTSKKLMGVVDYVLNGGNKLAIMDGSGYTTLVGNWTEDNGVFYSNSSYKKSYSQKVTLGYNDYLVGSSYHKGLKTQKGALSSGQIKALDLYGYVLCEDDAEYLQLEYDEKKCKYILVCPECGNVYDITDEQVDKLWDNDYFHYGYCY